MNSKTNQTLSYDKQFLTRALRGIIIVGQRYKKRNLQMPGNVRYQPKQLQPYFGYDQWVLWLMVVELCWLKFLETHQYDAKLSVPFKLQNDFEQMFKKMTTTIQDKIERKPGIGHDINALREMLLDYVQENFGFDQNYIDRYNHFALTSYDTIDTARGLMFSRAFNEQFIPQLKDLDDIWLIKMQEFSEVTQIGRTHLQNALPMLVGLWLAVIHRRFTEVVTQLVIFSRGLTGKASGAVGTSAALVALGIEGKLVKNVEKEFIVNFLGLGQPTYSTQIVPPERLTNFLFQHVMLSAVFGQLGEDARILQSSAIGEIKSVSSTSSTMAHKDSNPIAAEQLAGMYTTVVGEFHKILPNLISNLQRDLRNSSPARDYPAVVVYTFQQILTAQRLLKNMNVNASRCAENFHNTRYVIMGELLYLLLARAGMPQAHQFVNQKVTPLIKVSGTNMMATMDKLAEIDQTNVGKYWAEVSAIDKELLVHPESYLGNARQMIIDELNNPLF